MMGQPLVLCILLSLLGTALAHTCDGDHSLCQNGGVCHDSGTTSYYCDCPSTTRGTNCESRVYGCETNPCEHGATCNPATTTQSSNRGFTCSCLGGQGNNYTNVDCCHKQNRNLYNICATSPCLNGGTCTNANTLTDGSAGFSCQCPLGAGGWDGQWCQNSRDLDLCNPNQCQNGGACSMDTFQGTYVCTCANTATVTYGGKNCQYVYNDRGCNQPNAPTCLSGSCGTFTGKCGQCATGFSGQYCNETNPVINKCALLPCQNGAVCTDTLDDFTCACTNGWYGKTCGDGRISRCTNVDGANPCAHGICSQAVDTRMQNGLTAVMSPQYWKYSCVCDCGWTGRNCDIPASTVCDANPCLNGGSCLLNSAAFQMTPVAGPLLQTAGYFCSCPNGFTGVHCETSYSAVALYVDPCAEITPCLNQGWCTNPNLGFFDTRVASCACPYGFAGPRCQFPGPNFCAQAPCQNDATCFNTRSNSFACACADGFVGELCNVEDAYQNSGSALVPSMAALAALMAIILSS